MFCYTLSASTTQFLLWNGFEWRSKTTFSCGLEVHCSDENVPGPVSNSLLFTTEICREETYSDKRQIQRTSEKERHILKSLRMTRKGILKVQLTDRLVEGLAFCKTTVHLLRRCQKLRWKVLYWLNSIFFIKRIWNKTKQNTSLSIKKHYRGKNHTGQNMACAHIRPFGQFLVQYFMVKWDKWLYLNSITIL